jgi:hypothetical protein
MKHLRTKKKIAWRKYSMTDFVSVENVTDELNATGTYDEAIDTYTVFGIQVATVTISAIVADVNGYVSDFSNVDPASKQYSSGARAALALACMRVLVAASGGTVTDSDNYQVGDLSVAKSTVTVSAYVGAINAFRDAYHREIANFSLGGVVGKSVLAAHGARHHHYPKDDF